MENKKYALSLEGGGFRGAYQAGVIYALYESGMRFSAVCGTSVGSLNGALVAMDRIEEMKKLWLEFDVKNVFKFENDDLENLLEHDFGEIDIITLGKDIINTISNKGLDISPLIDLIDDVIDEEVLRTSPIDFGLVTYNLTDDKGEELMIRDIPKGLLKDYLLASSYLPGFKQRKLHGKYYIDGGVYNNLPSNMLVKNNYKDIIEIRLHKFSIHTKPKGECTIKTISTNEKLGSILMVEKGKMKRNFDLGYQDGLDFVKKNI